MRWITKYRKQRLGALAAAIAVTAWMPTVMALPETPTIYQSGVGEIKTSDDRKTMDIPITAPRAAIDWKTFNIANGERVNFNRSEAGWAVLNRVTGNVGKSTIDGILNGTGGTVFIVNPHGVTFGEHARVEVGSLVASTLDIDRDLFLKETSVTATGKNGGQEIHINEGAQIKASDKGVVALLANKIYKQNGATVTAGETYAIAGNSIEVKYADKISVALKESSNNDYIETSEINGGKGYVLMTAKAAVDLLSDTVNTPTIKADKITIDKDGNIALTGDKVLVDGSLTAGGTVTTTGTNVLQVNDTAVINAKKWNATGKNVDVVNGVEGNTATANKISNKALSKTLANTDVNIKAIPTSKTYYADINIKDKISKTEGGNTNLTFTAGRNISVDADIESKVGALNLTLNSNNRLEGKSNRNDGASIIKANIATNGGDFTTTGSIGTYFGLKNYGATNGESAGTERYVKTNGGAIHLGGDQVLLATGGAVLLDAGKGSVTIDGKVDSANAYRNEYVDTRNSNGQKISITWDKAVNDAQSKDGSHLAVITSRLEDAVVSAAIPKKNDETTEAYAGGHVVALPDGITFEFVEATDKEPAHVILKDNDGKTVDTISKDKLYLSYANGIKNFDEKNKIITGTTVTDIPNGIRKGYVMGGKTRGWYKIDNNTLVRLWAWTAGKEIGKVFYVEALKITDANDNAVTLPESMDNSTISTYKSNAYKLKYYNTAIGYANFRPGEPNDNLLQASHENALAVNYDTHDDNNRKDMLYSQWDDIFEGAVTTGQNAMQNYVVETEIPHTALNIKAGETTLGGDIGSDTKLSNLTINSSANVNAKGSVQVDNDVYAKADGSIIFNKAAEPAANILRSSLAEVPNKADEKKITEAGGNVTFIAGSGEKVAGEIKAGRDVSVGAVTAGKTVSMVADNNVTINDVVEAKAAGNNNAVEIVAQGNFYNESGVADSVKVGEGSAWKIYSNNPKDGNMGDLDSGNFAGWGWGNANGLTYIPSDGNRFIFKYNPTIVFTANNATKKYGETLSDTGFDYYNEMYGQYTGNFLDGKTRLGVSEANTTSAGYPANARVGTYDIYMVNADVAAAHGYNIVKTPGVLTVTGDNPGEVKPQLDPHDTTNVDGSASYTTAPQQAGPGADRVLGLQSAELPFFREENGQTKLYGTYDVSIDPDKVKMEPTAKVLPEPDQPKNQYREYDKDITTKVGTAKFKLTYNGSTFDIYPVDIFGKKVLKAGDAAKNVEVESQALFAAFKEMGITLDDLDGVYTHFDNKKEVQSFRK